MNKDVIIQGEKIIIMKAKIIDTKKGIHSKIIIEIVKMIIIDIKKGIVSEGSQQIGKNIKNKQESRIEINTILDNINTNREIVRE